MTTGSSTLRTNLDRTIGGSSTDLSAPSLRRAIEQEWQAAGQADLVGALERHPRLLQDRSLLLHLAIAEFRARHESASVDLEEYCARFERFGNSIERSIFRQLEAQRYVDENTDLLELFCDTKWPQVADDFGNFVVVEELGRGAIARVYRCLQRDIGHREVVVKATPYSGIEASVLGRLNHPNITPILSAGFVDEFNLHFVCMPYFGRSTLADLLDVAFESGYARRDEVIERAANRWNVENISSRKDLRALFLKFFSCGTYVDGVLTLAMQVADALGHAHQRRILHGDLKPSNVLLTPDGRPFLLDFNLSRDYATSLHRCGGTLSYMPPEYLEMVKGVPDRPRQDEFDPRSDVYSFGALLYELLSGTTPVLIPKNADSASEAAERVLDQLMRGVPAIQPHNPLVSRSLESVVLGCLAIDPRDRPASIEVVKKRLRQEMRTPAAITRRARVRPFGFLATRLSPVAVTIAALGYYAVQPPAYLADYNYALTLVETSELPRAVDYLNQSLQVNPAFSPARFQRGRSRMTLGEIDLAITDFDHLARKENHVKSMAYLGYCFNLKRISSVAIPWYERALEHGEKSLPVLNNLAASYLESQTHLAHSEQIRLAEQYLLEAWRLDSKSISVQLNLVRLAVAKRSIDPAYDPIDVWPYIQTVLATTTTIPDVESQIYSWYRAVNAYQATEATHSTNSGDPPSANQESVEQRRQIVAAALRRSGLAINRSRESARSSFHLYFLEPF